MLEVFANIVYSQRLHVGKNTLCFIVIDLVALLERVWIDRIQWLQDAPLSGKGPPLSPDVDRGGFASH